MPDKFWFTVSHSPVVGFTDTLYQFNSFYKLGCAMNGTYVHTPFMSRRSGRGVFDFLQFNQGWSLNMSQAEFKHKNIKKISLGDHVVEQEKITTFADLQRYVCSKVEEIQKAEGLAPVIAFELCGHRKFFRLIHLALPERPPEYPVNAAYRVLRERQSRKKGEQPKPLRVLVHIRQGDTATIRTPWNTYVPTLSWDKKRYQELPDPRQASRYVPPVMFFDFLKQFYRHLKPDRYAIRVFSDGYRAGFKGIYSRWRKRRISPWRWARLKLSEFNYDKKMFAVFRDLPHTRCFIGESDNHLYDLIRACLDADVIIIGTQQRFLPKLLSIYYDFKKPKILIVLTADGRVEDFTAVLGLPAAAVRIIPVLIQKYRFSDLWPVLTEAAKHCNIQL